METSTKWGGLQNMIENYPLELVGLMPVLAKEDKEVTENIWKEVIA